MPKVSIIIPCYNLGQYLDEAVNSVLAQTFIDFEIIIVNDGSTDEFTNELLNNYDRPKTRVLKTENQGLPSARNNGIKIAQGEFICCLDADDKYDPMFLEKTTLILNNDRDHKLGFVTSWLQMFEGSNLFWNPNSCNPIVLSTENIVHVASLFRKECWTKVGGYATNLKGYQDWNFWISIVTKGYEWKQIQEPLFFYRVRKNSMVTESNQKRFLLYSQIIENNKPFYIKNIKSILIEFQKKNLESLRIIEETQESLRITNETIEQIINSRTYQLGLICKNSFTSWKCFLLLPYKLIWFLIPVNIKQCIKKCFKFF